MFMVSKMAEPGRLKFEIQIYQNTYL